MAGNEIFGVLENGPYIRSDERPPGARMRVAQAALTMAEYFRDERVRMCCYSLIIFLGTFKPVPRCPHFWKNPSAVGYQPTLSVDVGILQERITSTKKVL